MKNLDQCKGSDEFYEKVDLDQCCRSSTKQHIQTSGCGGTHGSSSHHHHHNQNHSHKHCCSDEKKVSQPQKCASQTYSSTCPPCPSNSSSCASANCCNTMKNLDQCKRSDEFHEKDHCHRGRCNKNQDGVQKHDTEKEGCSDLPSLMLNAEDDGAVAVNKHGCCLGHESHVTKRCHKQNSDVIIHDSAPLSSTCHLNPSSQKESTDDHCHLIHGCENMKGHKPEDMLGCNHDIKHAKSGCHSGFKKQETDEISIDIVNEHAELASMHDCSSLEEKEKGPCCKGCSDTREKLLLEKVDNACCTNDCSSIECKESPIVHACLGLDKREVGGCCKSCMKECCAKHGHQELVL